MAARAAHPASAARAATDSAGPSTTPVRSPTITGPWRGRDAVRLSDSLVIGNLAQGGGAGSGGTAGQGIGGGLYLATGSTTTLTTTIVVLNRASTSNNDIYGTYGS